MTDKEYVTFKNGEFIINFMYEPPPPPEFRLYYDSNGNVLFYTGEKIEGDNYIVVDAKTFAEARVDLKVIDGNIVYNSSLTQIFKVKPSESGTLTSNEDVTLILHSNENSDGQFWNITTSNYLNR